MLRYCADLCAQLETPAPDRFTVRFWSGERELGGFGGLPFRADVACATVEGDAEWFCTGQDGEALAKTGEYRVFEDAEEAPAAPAARRPSLWAVVPAAGRAVAGTGTRVRPRFLNAESVPRLHDSRGTLLCAGRLRRSWEPPASSGR